MGKRRKQLQRLPFVGGVCCDPNRRDSCRSGPLSQVTTNEAARNRGRTFFHSLGAGSPKPRWPRGPSSLQPEGRRLPAPSRFWRLLTLLSRWPCKSSRLRRPSAAFPLSLVSRYPPPFSDEDPGHWAQPPAEVISSGDAAVRVQRSSSHVPHTHGFRA